MHVVNSFVYCKLLPSVNIHSKQGVLELRGACGPSSELSHCTATL